jgi:hypothetical protein
VVHPFSICACNHGLLSFVGGLGPHSIDLSNATKLKDVVFQLNLRSFEWATTALQTITSNHRELQQISIRVAGFWEFARTSTSFNAGQTDGGQRQWPGLDRLLVQFWVSRSIRPKVTCTEPGVDNNLPYVSPEMTRRELIEYASE